MDDSTKTKRQVSIGQVHAGGGIDPGGVLSSRPDFYRFLLDHFPDAVLIEDQNGRILECNRAALEIFGYAREEMLGLNIKDLVPREVASSIPEFIDETSTTAGVFVWIGCRKRNGTIFPTQYCTQMIDIEGRKRILTFIRDVSENYCCRLPVLHGQIAGPAPVFHEYPDLCLTWESRGDTFVLIGYDDRAIGSTRDLIKNYIGRTVHELYHERQDIISDFTRCFTEKAVLKRKTLYNMFTTGEERIAEITYTFIHPGLVVMYLEDFTERDTAEALNRSFVRSSPVGLCLIQNGRIKYANPQLQEYLGCRESELDEADILTFIHQDDRHLISEALAQDHIVETPGMPIELRLLTKGRDLRWVMVTFTTILYLKRQALLLTLVNITENKRAEESLKESQRILATLMGNLPGMAYRCRNDRRWTMEFVSEGSYALTGYAPAELIESSKVAYGDLIHPDDREFVWGSVQGSLKARERFQIMYRIVTPKGRVKWVWEKGMGIFSPEGELIALEGFISDITDRKLTEEKLRRSRKQLRIHAEHLHSVLEGERSQIAREIHDELGQILTALKMDLFWVDRKVPEKNAEIHEKVHSMISHIDSTIKTVEHILLELRPGLLEDLGLTSAIEWQAEEFQRRTGIVCDAILDPDPERLIKDSKLSTAVFRICQEALTNIARHAYATKVEITLKLTRSFVELMVSDNGQGIMRSDIRKADSFGILGIRERTSLLGGKVTIAGRKGKGTTLRVRIPLSQSQSA